MRADGRSPIWLLRYLDSRGLGQVQAMSYFREAFGLDSDDVSPIGAWFGDGAGELSDEDIDLQLEQAIAAREALRAAGLPDRMVVERGPFMLDVSRAHRWCRLTHAQTQKNAWLHCAQRQCGGDVSWRRTEDGAWACDEWSLLVRFPSVDGEKLKVESSEYGTLLDEVV